MTSPTRPIAWLSLDIMLIAPRSWRTSSAAIVSPRIRLSANATSSGMLLVEVMTHHQHVEVLVERVHGVGSRGIGRARQHVRLAAHANDVGRVPAASAFGVIRVNRPALEGRDRVVDVARFVQRVGVERDLHVVEVGDRQARIDGRRASCPSPRGA